MTIRPLAALCMSCGLAACLNPGTVPETGNKQGKETAEPTRQTETEHSGTISAQPEADDPEIQFAVQTAAIGRSYFGVHILLTDLSDHPVAEDGTWEKLPGDLEAPYHRVRITLEDLPETAGAVAPSRLEYSVHDKDSGPFNYGWTKLDGAVVIDSIAGTIESSEGDHGAMNQTRLEGHFDLTNNRGGHFSGAFRIIPGES